MLESTIFKNRKNIQTQGIASLYCQLLSLKKKKRKKRKRLGFFFWNIFFLSLLANILCMTNKTYYGAGTEV